MIKRLNGRQSGLVSVLALGVTGMFVACGDGSSTGSGCPDASTCSGGGSDAGAPGPSDAGGTDSETSGTAGLGGGSEAQSGAGPTDEDRPQVVSVTPTDTADDAEPTTAVVITFSEPLNPDTVTATSVQLLDGDSVVPAAISYADGVVTLKPDQPLGLLTSYSVAVGTDIADEQGATLAAAFSSAFMVRDGVWTTTQAVTGDIYQISDTLPMSATGDVLLAWIAANKPGFYCPTSARWFSLGEPTTPIKLMTGNDVQDCRSVTAASNATGTAAVVWQEDAEFAQQFREGAWLPGKPKVSTSGTTYNYSVAVEPDGKVTFFQHAVTGQAWRTDENGNWNQAPDVVSDELADGKASIVFDADGNGFAAWRAHKDTWHQKILVSRYTTAQGKWSTATTLPGSLAAATTPTSERGNPALAVDLQGDAVLLWVKKDGAASLLMSSRYHEGSGWASAVLVSSDLIVKPVFDQPALLFDGQTFVAAWTAQGGAFVHTYTARYDMQGDKWGAHDQRTPNAELPSVERMPKLATDAHGNLMLVWARGSEFAYQRYAAATGSWGASTLLPGGTIEDANLASGPRMPLGVAANGRAALMWSRYDEGYHDIQLASFF